MGIIFLSHVEEDQAVMQQVALGLEAAGYTTWYFERDVLPGTSYLIQITRAIEESDAIVLIISPEALGSDQVTKEVVGAFERGKAFFPLLVNITPSELKQQQPEWRHALGGTAMIMADMEEFPVTLESIIKGLKSKNIETGTAGQPSSNPPSHMVPAMETGDGERKNVTVMFASISGFSSLSGKMDAEEVTELMNECFSIMKKCIEEHGGTINKFIGDSAMVLFGAPRAQEDAPHRALDAAFEMRKRLQVFNGAGNLHEDLNIHIGINTGTVITGKAGGDRREDYTVTGETVNLASHMQNSAGRGEILASESTYRLTEGYFDFKDLGPVNLKCTEQPVHSYSLIGPREVRSRVAASLMKGLTPFKGRSMEMTRLMDCYKKTGEGEGQVIGIMGEPGMGKSRLVLEFIQSLPAGAYINLSGSCQHFGDAIPYLPIVEIIGDYLDIKDGDNETVIREKAAAKISQLEGIPETVIPPLHEFLSLKVDDKSYSKLDGKQRRDKVFDSIRLLLFAESRAKPLVIVVDDLHWIDHTSEEFLGYLVNSIAATRIMLVLLYRPEYTHSWSKKTYYSQIQLGHLPGDTSKDLIQAILDDGDVDSDINDLIIATTSGNPLFIEELTHSLIENCSIGKSEGKYILKSQPSEIRIPDTIQGIIADRLDRLELNLKKILQTASVIGREFAFRVLEAVATLKDDLKGALASLQDLELIYEEAVSPELEYIFKHALTREVAYNTILLKKRRETHELVAQSIERLYAERIGEFYELLAYHYSKGGNSRKACRYYQLSANKALMKYSNNEVLQRGATDAG